MDMLLYSIITLQTGSENNINAEIYRQASEITFNDALAQCRETYQLLLDLITAVTDDDLQKPYREYLPDEPREGDGPPAMNVIYGNTAHHYMEHLGWIEALVNTSG